MPGDAALNRNRVVTNLAGFGGDIEEVSGW